MRDLGTRFALAGALALVAVSACSSGTPTKSTSHDTRGEPTAWARAHLKSLGGFHGKFRSEIVTRACAQPPTKPCTVGGAVVVDSGTFTRHSDSSSYLHVAFGNGADVTELAGYRVRNLANGDTFIQAVSRGRSSRCWTPVSSSLEFGSELAYLQGFDVVNDAEPYVDPPATRGATRLLGHVDARDVLDYLGASDLDRYVEFNQQVPVHLRMDKGGNATGFWVDGEEIATALVGPAPDGPGTNGAAFVPTDDEEDHAAEVRRVLTPVHGDFRMYALDSTPATVVAPAKDLLLSAEAKKRHQTCAAAR